MGGMEFVTRIIANAIAVWLTSLALGSHFVIVGTSNVAGEDPNALLNRILVITGVGLLFALVNSIIKPLAKALSCGLYILTLGLFGLVLNALMVLLVDWLTKHTSWGIDVTGFWWAMLAGVILSFLNAVITTLLGGKRA